MRESHSVRRPLTTSWCARAASSSVSDARPASVTASPLSSSPQGGGVVGRIVGGLKCLCRWSLSFEKRCDAQWQRRRHVKSSVICHLPVAIRLLNKQNCLRTTKTLYAANEKQKRDDWIHPACQHVIILFFDFCYFFIFQFITTITSHPPLETYNCKHYLPL